MAYWFCEYCGWTVPARPGDSEPEFCEGHDENDDLTLGTIWSLHEKCRRCGRDYQVGTLVCPKCKTPTNDDVFANTPPPQSPSAGCSGCTSQGCLISFIGVAVAAVWAIAASFNKTKRTQNRNGGGE